MLDRVHVERAPTGLVHLTLTLSDPARWMDPGMVHGLGNILLDCLAPGGRMTAVLWTITVSVRLPQSRSAGAMPGGRRR